MFLGRTIAVGNKLIKDVEKVLFWITLVVQLVFFVFYGYSIFTNFNNLIFLIIYSLLGTLSIFNFVHTIVTHPYRKKEKVKKVKFFARIFKYIINGTMLGVNIFEMINYGGTDFNKIMIIVSAISLVVQIIFEIIVPVMSNYINLFITSVKMDFNFIIKIANFVNPDGAKGNFFELLDLPFEAIANRIEGKEPELTETEAYLNELALEYETIKRKEVKENSQIKAEKQKKELVEHLHIIKNKLFRRKKKSRSSEE